MCDDETPSLANPLRLSGFDLDVPAEIDRIVSFLNGNVFQRFKKRGAVVGISGGIDSSVVLALCVKAFGVERVVGIMLPEDESEPESEVLAKELADRYNVEVVSEPITGVLDGFGCYERRNEAIQRLFPDFGPGWHAKITLPGSLLSEKTLNVFYLSVVSPSGQECRKRLPPREFYQIVAASNFKQRSRMGMLYYHAELRSFAVVGTANKNEHALGFFVKHGDGGVDIQPIGHLFKTQVYQLAAKLDIPKSIQERTPTTDTYPGGSTQEEFFFRLPFHILDQVWYGYEQGLDSQVIAKSLTLTEEQVERIIADTKRKQSTTAYLRMRSVFLEDSQS